MKGQFLIEASEKAYDFLSAIRFSQWSTRGLGIDLSPSEMDELLKELWAAIVHAKKQIKALKHLTSCAAHYDKGAICQCGADRGGGMTLLERIDLMSSVRKQIRREVKHQAKQQQIEASLKKLRAINPLLKKWYGEIELKG